MSRKKKSNQEETALIDGHCTDCIDALLLCVNESDPASRAMYKQKAFSICKSCSHFMTLGLGKK
ncbi:MAG: hypothetical protein FJZ59_03090 [Chlamydiae bacterium]|jgi:hypothetical protein|nr:hypothetical protein [Chlamydiota bacterium]